MAKATFAAGCFWGVEESFRNLPGVTGTAVGYIGGSLENPSYEDVCTGRTGHAEAVEVDYDAAQLSFEKLLDVFWEAHDPTTLNSQGPDFGTQYRSAIYYHSPEQEATARESKRLLDESGKFRDSAVTELAAAGKFWRAEDYHQQYFAKRGMAFRCH